MNQVNAKRLRSDLESLARIGAVPREGITRTAFSTEDSLARGWYRDRVEEAGLRLELDGLGNMVVCDLASAQEVPAVWSGSHLDTVPNGGAFDGAVGAVAALECLRRVTELKLELPRPLRAVVFSDEEGNYASLLGSSGMRHGFSRAELAAMVGRDGDRLLDALAVWPWSTGLPTETRVDPARIHAFIELHIEQGARLEAAKTDIGIVTAIVGLGSAHVTFIGDVDHAGTTKMTARRDALVGAAEFIARVPDIPRAVGSDCVATAGWMRLHPNVANVVPGRAEVSLDFRDLSRANVERMGDELEQLARRIAAERSLEVRWNAHPVISPAPLDEQVQSAIGDAAAGRGLSSMRLPSGAGHDSQNMAPLAPTGMIFIPSVGGRSHSPAELTHWPDIVNGANVLLDTMIRLAGS